MEGCYVSVSAGRLVASVYVSHGCHIYDEFIPSVDLQQLVHQFLVIGGNRTGSSAYRFAREV